MIKYPTVKLAKKVLIKLFLNASIIRKKAGAKNL